MATHSSTLAWRIPWTEEPGWLQSMGSQSQTRLSNLACMHAETDILIHESIFLKIQCFSHDFKRH